MEIPEYQKKMIGAFDTYIKYVPDAPELVTIKYRKARIYYEYNHFDEAVEAVRGHRAEVPEARAGDLLGQPAARLLERLRARPRRSSSWVDKFLEMPELMKDPEFGKQMISLKSDTYDMEGHAVREGEELQGVRPLDAGRRRVPPRSPEARRAALERRPVLPERPPRRAGAQGARRS